VSPDQFADLPNRFADGQDRVSPLLEFLSDKI
jgi:hypothetical protein